MVEVPPKKPASVLEYTKTHPVQVPGRRYGVDNSRAPTSVTLRAYEVYCHLYGAQEAMVTGGCRGGFSAGELIAFLYAHSFPEEEWRRRAEEASRGMEHL